MCANADAALSHPLGTEARLFAITDPSLAATTLGIATVAIFVLAYLLVVLEDRIHLRKSKPVLLAAGVMWILTALAFAGQGPEGAAHIESQVAHHVGDFAQLFLFLMVAMTYISAISKHNVFLWLNAWLVSRGFGLRAIFWATGGLAFCISPIADNLTTALLMGAVVIAVGRGNPLFIGAACTNIVVAANAGGAFSPFGDITTLMVCALPPFFSVFLGQAGSLLQCPSCPQPRQGLVFIISLSRASLSAFACADGSGLLK